MGKVDTMRKRRTYLEAETPDHHYRKRSRRPKKKSKGAGGFGPSTAAMLNANYTRLADSPTDLSVWMDRRSLVGQLSFFDWGKELSLIEELAEELADAKKHPNNYLFWDYRRWIVEKIGSGSAIPAIKELEFTKKILTKGTENCQAWLYREWIIRKFDKACLWWPELSFCHEILEKDIFNVSAWDQICRVVRELKPDSDSKLRDIETKYARKAIQAQPGNEGPWVYLRFLYEGDKRMLYKDPNLECIYVNVLAEGADRLKSCLELDRHYNMMYALVDCRGCVLALNLIMDLMTFGYKVDHNTRLLEAVNFLIDKAGYRYGRLAGDVISGMPRDVLSLMRSLDALRMRFCYMFHWYSWDPRFNLRFAVEESPRTETEALEIPPPSREKFESMFNCSISEHVKKIERTKQESLCERFYQTHLRKVKGQGIPEDHSLELVKWELRRFDVTSFGGASAALVELKYTTDIIKKDPTSHHAWSHRQWLFQAFGEDWEDKAWEEIGELELDFCKEILENNSCNIFAWDQRCFVVKRRLLKIEVLNYTQRDIEDKVVLDRIEKLDKECERKRGEEILFAQKFIASEAQNPFPWCHMFGVTHCFRFADYGPGIMSRVLDAMLCVLEDTRDYCAARGVGLGEGGGSCINGKGVLNVLNMHLDFINHHPGIFHHPETEEQFWKLDDVLADLYPGPVVTDDAVGRMCGIFDRMRLGVVGHGLAWESVVDDILKR